MRVLFAVAVAVALTGCQGITIESCSVACRRLDLAPEVSAAGDCRCAPIAPTAITPTPAKAIA